MPAEEIQTASETETADVAEQLGRRLHSGDVVLLMGPLGAGKTAFVRGLARGLGIADSEVTSPTFTLIQEYSGGRATLYHVDLYRLEPREAADLGLDELLVDGGVAAIEWAERWHDWPADAIEVRIEDRGAAQRRIEITRSDYSTR